MKKTFLYSVLCTLSFVLCLETLAYTSEDTTNARALAEADIIVDHENHADFRLDDAITRQEVIGMTLKLKWVALPTEYDCKGYFSDANFPKSHTDNWVCRAVELAADRGLITRDNSSTRPRDTITKAEALALAWKWSGLRIESGLGNGIFVDAKNVPALPWQENLLQTALQSAIISAESVTKEDVVQYLWKHNDPASRKEVFKLFSTLLMVKQMRDQTLFLNFSGEVQYRPDKIRIISEDSDLVDMIQKKDFSTILAAISPSPLEYRTEWSTLFIMGNKAGQWWKFSYSSISTLMGKVIQLYSPYDPYEKALSQMLARFNLKTEDDFYALPYGELYEKTRDFIEQFVSDEFMNAPIVYPSAS